MNGGIPHEYKESLENLPVDTKRKLLTMYDHGIAIEGPGGPTKDPGEYLTKLKHVMDAGKDYKVCWPLTQSDSCRELLHLCLDCLLPCSR